MTDEEVRALFDKGVPEAEVYDILVHQVLESLAEKILRVTAKEGDPPEEAADRLEYVNESIALAAVISSTFVLEDIDPEAAHGTLLELADIIEEGLPCDDATCACHDEDDLV